jgi:hypothetical protein
VIGDSVSRLAGGRCSGVVVLFPYFCEREGLYDCIPDGGGWWVAVSSVLRPTTPDLGLLLLLRAPTLKLLMFFQGFRRVLSVVSRRWLLQLNKVWASSFKLGEEHVLRTGILIVDGV